MPISTGALVEFFGTQDTLGNTPTAIADDSMSLATDVVAWINDDDAPMASATLSVTFAVAPDVSTSVNLFVKVNNVQGTNDQQEPTVQKPHTYLGTFPVDAVTTAQFQTIDIALPNAYASTEFVFFIENKCGQTVPAGWDLFITPKSYGPKA